LRLVVEELRDVVLEDQLEVADWTVAQPGMMISGIPFSSLSLL